MKKGDDSFYAPWIKYLNREPSGHIPSQYSSHAKKLLQQLVGEHPDTINRGPFMMRRKAKTHRLMPKFLTEKLERSWFWNCNGTRDDAIEIKAAGMIIHRSDDGVLIPTYDSFNHRNNDKHNENEYTNAKFRIIEGKYHAPPRNH